MPETGKSEQYVVIAEYRLLKGDTVVNDWSCVMDLVQRFGSRVEAEVARENRERADSVAKDAYVPHGCRRERRTWVGTIVPGEGDLTDG